MGNLMNNDSISYIAVTEAAKAGLELFRDTDGRLTLTDGKLSLCADFSDSIRRIKPDNLSRELLVRAAKLKSKSKSGGGSSNSTATTRPLAIDATAGFGEDSILLAAAGFEVVMYEYDAVIAALLEDALRRASESDNDKLRAAVSHMKLINADSIEAMQHLQEKPNEHSQEKPDEHLQKPDEHLQKKPDIILLDPMFPAREKSALIKKKFQLLQRLEQPCTDEEALLNAALSVHPHKLIIKRPLKGAYLASRKPDYSIKGKAIRYDCIVMADDKTV